LASVRKQIAFEKRAQQDALESWEDAMTEYKGGVSGPLTPLVTRQQLLVADQRTAVLESEEADISIRLIEALGGGFGAASNANSVSRRGDATADGSRIGR
jgi:outer membrane protein TolC